MIDYLEKTIFSVGVLVIVIVVFGVTYDAIVSYYDPSPWWLGALYATRVGLSVWVWVSIVNYFRARRR